MLQRQASTGCAVLCGVLIFVLSGANQYSPFGEDDDDDGDDVAAAICEHHLRLSDRQNSSGVGWRGTASGQTSLDVDIYRCLPSVSGIPDGRLADGDHVITYLGPSPPCGVLQLEVQSIQIPKQAHKRLT